MFPQNFKVINFNKTVKQTRTQFLIVSKISYHNLKVIYRHSDWSRFVVKYVVEKITVYKFLTGPLVPDVSVAISLVLAYIVSRPN